ncbi:DUF4082 domain-containing protein [Microbacterium sp. dk485]|uniref:DUF4082 domain-containing protein n=1 Tax=Microbacterium sp. dk485 TaxID=2560021 RepID=UPI001ADD8E7C|nr:DUF4082 domain-containing protein [Microbacterium sp. dk485]
MNPIECENREPGTDPDVWDIDGAGDPSIQGFATDISVNAGDRVDFKIDTDAADYDIDIYRTGWYQGLGARLIDSVEPSAPLPQVQDECLSDLATELYDCGTWDVSASWDVPEHAVSGVYLARLERTDTGGASHIIFIVRRDGNTSDVLFQTSDPTWHAYNTYGGSDFYQGAANGRAYKISYNRPFATRGGIEKRDFYFSSEYATVRFLERNGYDMSYIAGMDTDRRGAELLNHKVFLSVGHDEYWSGAQRANIEAARDAGVNLQFLAGNEGYWRTRYEPSTVGEQGDRRTLVSYKETWGDRDHLGGGKIDPSPEWTGTWRDPRFAAAENGGASPENALIGTMYMVNHDDLALTVAGEQGGFRLWRYTGLDDLDEDETAPLAPHTVGYESNEDIDNGHRPPGLIRLSTTIGPTPQYLTDYGNTLVEGTTRHHVTLYRAASGALVFSAATVQWGWGLDDGHDGNGAPPDRRMQQAQVNLLADMGAQPGSLQHGLAAAAPSHDTIAPETVITSPQEGETVAHGATVLVTGTASDGGGRVAGVEVSTDGGISWHPAEGTEEWSYEYVQQGAASATILARAIDDSANFATVGVQRTVAVTGPYTVFGDEVPLNTSAADDRPVELGLRFTPEVDGFVSGVRFFKGERNTGTQVGSLWDDAGRRLDQVVFPGGTGEGWQGARFASAVPVTAGRTYTVSYTAPAGGYAMDARYWPYRSAASSPLSVASAVGAGAAGVFGAPGEFPASSFGESNYFVDVVFEFTDTSPLRVLASTPATGTSSIALDAAVTATLSRAIDPGAVGLHVAGAGGEVVAGDLSFDAPSRTVRFIPHAPLAASTTYTVTVTVGGDAIQVGEEDAWSFTTRAPDRAEGDCPCSLFNESRSPSIASVDDAGPVTLGVTFTPSSDGVITALRFFKGPGNAGEHTGTLWDSDREAMAHVEFANETAGGWQTAEFDAPVEVEGGRTYVASYLAPRGGYSATPGVFTTAYERGPLSVGAGGAVFTYHGAYPAEGSATDYGVDVVFEPDAPPPLIVARTPEAGAVAAASATVSATFDRAIEPEFAGVVTGDGAAVAGNWTISPDGRTITFQPDTRLPEGAHVVVSLTGVRSTDGAAADDQTWSFTVGAAAASLTLLGTSTPQSITPAGSPAVELGMAFTSSAAGTVTALRFYKVAGDTGVHTGSLWGPDGQRLAHVEFTAESPSGWQRAELTTPVALLPGVTYTVSYHSSHGAYGFTHEGLGTPLSSGSLTTVTGDNGRFRYGPGGLVPGDSWRASNYFADIEFRPAAPAGPAVTARTPVGQDVAPDAVISATFGGTPSSPAIEVSAGGAPVAGTSEYAAATRTVTFAPAAGLAAGTVHTVTVRNGGAVVDQWIFTTAPSEDAGMTVTVFGDRAPAIAATSDTDAVEVGTAFTVDRPGQVTALRFYKGPGNTGTHVGSLWNSQGDRLITATFANETASGWQRVHLPAPVTVQPGETYVVSYFAPQGRYSREDDYFTSARSDGPLTAPAGHNGRFLYAAAGGYPTGSWRSSAYFVDAEVVFADAPAPDPSGPVTVQDVQPAEQERDVAPTTTVSAALQPAPAAAELALRGPGDSPVAGESAYDAATGALVFTPAEPLEWSRSYTATVTAPGRAVDGGTWSFTTVREPGEVQVHSLLGQATPQHPWWDDTNEAQVATRFLVAAPGEVTGVRFYKGAANTGVHTGYLWDPAGNRIAEVAFADETAEGWQTALFASPVPLEAGVEYRVGLHSTTGRYAIDFDGFGAQTTTGPFTVPANGSAFTYGRSYPVQLSTHNYWVDVLFESSG